MGDKDETRNLILAIALSMLVIIGWYAVFPPADPPPEQPGAEQAGGQGGEATGGQAGAPGAGASQTTATTRADALDRAERVAVETPSLSGSISLEGGRIDDLHLKDYRETIEPGADNVNLLNPTGAPNPYFAVYGWLRTATGSPGELPGPDTPWEVVSSGDTLTPDSPVTLEWQNGAGLTFRRTLSVDDEYMFTVTQTVSNTGGSAAELAPYGYVARRGQPQTRGMWILHEGAVGVIDDELHEADYDALLEQQPNSLEGGRVQAWSVERNGWLGFTDKYWMTALAPEPGQTFDAIYKAIPRTRPEFRTEMRLPVMSIAPGESAEMTTRLFAGAKEVETLQSYQEELGIARLEDAVDWGWFYFLTKPLFTVLHWLNGLIGNMGFAIIGLTFIIKAILFPLAYKSYVSMSKMKGLQPEMEKIKERAGDDKQKLQQEMMELYKKEKVNPASGCLPILLQIPIFFSLYKVLFVTIEMRHAPFIGWIEDLSAPDPTSFINLFGLLPYEVPAMLGLVSIGVYPILMGVSMWLQQKLNPTPTDPTQQMIFAWMPWVFMFILGQFAAGLVLYWLTNNVLTFAQQYLIMRSQGVEVDLFGNIKRSFKRKPAEAKPAGAAVSGAAATGPAKPVPKNGGGEASSGSAPAGNDVSSDTTDSEDARESDKDSGEGGAGSGKGQAAGPGSGKRSRSPKGGGGRSGQAGRGGRGQGKGGPRKGGGPR